MWVGVWGIVLGGGWVVWLRGVLGVGRIKGRAMGVLVLWGEVLVVW